MGAASGCSLQLESVPCSRGDDTSHWSCQIFPFPRQALCLIRWNHWSSSFHALWVSAQQNWCWSFKKQVMGKDLFLNTWNSRRIPVSVINISHWNYLLQGNSSKFLVKGFQKLFQWSRFLFNNRVTLWCHRKLFLREVWACSGFVNIPSNSRSDLAAAEFVVWEWIIWETFITGMSQELWASWVSEGNCLSIKRGNALPKSISGIYKICIKWLQGWRSGSQKYHKGSQTGAHDGSLITRWCWCCLAF